MTYRELTTLARAANLRTRQGTGNLAALCRLAGVSKQRVYAHRAPGKQLPDKLAVRLIAALPRRMR